MNNRNINIDLTKCIAIFFVICVHFFLHTNFYTTTINCPRMLIMTCMRTAFMVCVPLFLIITGYLFYNKSFKNYKTHLIKIIYIIVPYIIISIITYLAKVFLTKYGIFNEIWSFKNMLKGLLTGNIIGYCWYIKMYLGLYLLIPFLNKMLSSKKMDTILIIVLFLLTITSEFLPLNIYWQNLWPVTYYISGAYIAKYNVMKGTRYNLAGLYFISLALSCLIICINTYGFNFLISISKIGEWYSFENYTMSILLFLTLINLDLQKIKKTFQKFITATAKLSLGIYLSSYLFDTIIYYYFNKFIKFIPAKLDWFPVAVIIIFTLSLLLAYIADKITKLIYKNKN